MAFSMSDIQKGVKKMARKIVIYGPPKLGKSTLAGSTEKALMIPTEDRVAHIKCDKTPVVTSLKEITEIFNFLLKKENKHGYKRIIIDTLDWLEPLIHQAIVEDLKSSGKKVESITDDHTKETAFQKGLKYLAVNKWKDFLANCDALRAAGFDIILVAHSQTITINPPNSDPYDKYVMKIDKHSLAVIEEWADTIAFYDKKVFLKTDSSGINKKNKATQGSERTMYLSGNNPAMINGNSFGLEDIVDGGITLANCSAIMEWLLTESNN